MSDPSQAPTAALGGTLERLPSGEWQWRDGTPEPRARDLDRNAHYNFRCRATGSGKYIEVPKGLVLEETDLGWIKGCDYEIGADGDRTGPLEMTDEGMVRGGIRPGEDPIGGKGEPVLGVPIPSVVLVPLGDWREWIQNASPLGVEWDAADQEAILARARELGWEG